MEYVIKNNTHVFIFKLVIPSIGLSLLSSFKYAIMYELQNPRLNSLWNRLLFSFSNANDAIIYFVRKILMHFKILIAFYAVSKYKKKYFNELNFNISYDWIVTKFK